MSSVYHPKPPEEPKNIPFSDGSGTSQWYQDQLNAFRDQMANAHFLVAQQELQREAWERAKTASDKSRDDALTRLQSEQKTLAEELARRQGAYNDDMAYMRMAAANNKDRGLQGQLDSTRGYQESPYWQAMNQTQNQYQSVTTQANRLQDGFGAMPNYDWRFGYYQRDQDPYAALGGVISAWRTERELEYGLAEATSRENKYQSDLDRYIQWKISQNLNDGSFRPWDDPYRDWPLEDAANQGPGLTSGGRARPWTDYL